MAKTENAKQKQMAQSSKGKGSKTASPKKSSTKRPVQADVSQPKITTMLKATPPSKKIKSEKAKAEKTKSEGDNGSTKFSQAGIRSIMTRANPEMNISASVPQLMSTAAVQFATYISQTALENSIKRRAKKDDSFKVDYIDVAVSVNKDPRLEALHDNVPYQVTAEEALKRREEFLKKHPI